MQKIKASEIQRKNLISFLKLEENSIYIPIVEEYFIDRISPLYGPQESAITKIKQHKDRTCEVMLVGHNPVGFLVYKNNLQNELDIISGFELKTLALFSPEKNSRKGFGSLLYKRVDDLAKEKHAKCVFCTVNIEEESSYKCLLKNGFHLEKQLDKNIFLGVKNI